MNLPEINVTRIALCQDCLQFDGRGVKGYCSLRKELAEATDRACRLVQVKPKEIKKPVKI